MAWQTAFGAFLSRAHMVFLTCSSHFWTQTSCVWDEATPHEQKVEEKAHCHACPFLHGATTTEKLTKEGAELWVHAHTWATRGLIWINTERSWKRMGLTIGPPCSTPLASLKPGFAFVLSLIDVLFAVDWNCLHVTCTWRSRPFRFICISPVFLHINTVHSVSTTAKIKQKKFAPPVESSWWILLFLQLQHLLHLKKELKSFCPHVAKSLFDAWNNNSTHLFFFSMCQSLSNYPSCKFFIYCLGIPQGMDWRYHLI